MNAFRIAVCVWLLAACQPAPQPPETTSPLGRALAGTPHPGFARAHKVPQLEFPRDHGAHPDFQTEWWYFTGHLRAGERTLGYQLTFFRQALSPDQPAHATPWATRQVLMAHLAMTDVTGKRFLFAERLARGRPDLAWAAEGALEVVVEDWSALAQGQRLRLVAADGEMGIELEVQLAGPMLFHGDQGLSHKSAEPGNASYYYSMPRLPTQGTVRGPFGELAVKGTSWLDREWSTSVLAEDQVGWDWFSIRLEPDIDLMLFQLRDRRGASHRFAAGTLRRGDHVMHLNTDDFQLTPGQRWRSPHSAASYPLHWQIQIPAAGLTLAARPLLDDQEMNLAFRYWEGAIAVTGVDHDQPVAGLGYLELTGYGSAAGNGEQHE